MSCGYNEISYYESVDSLEEQLEVTRAIIKALRAQALKAAANEDIETYKLDDGQTVIWTTYRSAEQIGKGLLSWRQEEQRIINDLEGNVSTFTPCRTRRYGRLRTC